MKGNRNMSAPIPETGRPRVSMVVTDIDNTLYDWFLIWYTSFKAMVDTLASLTDLTPESFYSDIRPVFQNYGTSEFESFLLNSSKLRSLFSDSEIEEVNRRIIEAGANAARGNMVLYPTVLETLRTLHQRRIRIVAYTESMPLYTMRRLVNLGLAGLIDILYTPMHRHAVPEEKQLEAQLSPTIHLYENALKPNPQALLDMIERAGGSPTQCIYVGDSLMKDIAMAQDAGVIDVWAKYGTAQDLPEYNVLRLVSHWTEEDVQRERMIYSRGAVSPSYILNNDFGEILNLFDFYALTA